jgi:pimeloyl-ACP methyl ester carboxylesterase
VVLTQLTGGPKLEPLAHRLMVTVREEDATVQLADGPVRARRYLPEGVAAAPGVVLLHGVHPRGIDEKRLRAFARSLAGAGVCVLTPELSELLAYRIDASTTKKIRALASTHAAFTHRTSSAVLGISFAGGLALIAAAEQGGPTPIGSVIAVGAHDDLLRLVRYYAGEPVRGPNGEPSDVAPHPYGARVMIREHLERFFSPSDVPLARRALDSYLRDRHVMARKLAEGLPASAQPIMNTLLSDGGSPELAALLTEAASATRDTLQRASPSGKLARLSVPVFLVHGEGDPIIPSIETRWLAHELPPGALRRVVVTPLLRHAEFPRAPEPGEAWELITFMREILESIGSAKRAGSDQRSTSRPRMPNSNSSADSSLRPSSEPTGARLRRNTSLNAPISAVATTGG